ncbi:acetoacetate decarboxylase [Phreatobacter stygius]|uniref:Acetoacetate decarboxylase n=1 Tax=Phreatobacter stygius TaxID=1940610 RepID=A0A4D7BAP1_9HYPH|nr:acetoacetate decarboxylase [Phreatobacter stygius]QCI67753.1 acetoacetate decarboxylase [Phreatobacter stygius]
MKAQDVRASAFAMPLHRPSFPPGPYCFVDREYLTISYRTDRALIERVVPKPLEVIDAAVRIEFVRMPDSTGFGAYSGAAQVIPVKFGQETGSYTRFMFLDTHPPISGGRELWGFPQKLAGPKLAVEHDTLVGTLDFGRVRVATGTMGYKHRRADAEATLAGFLEPTFLLKIIPHVDGSPRICELVRVTKSDVTVKGAWTGPSALRLHPHALAPLADLPMAGEVTGLHMIADYTLDLGTVVHDYLA